MQLGSCHGNNGKALNLESKVADSLFPLSERKKKMFS